RGRVDRSPGLFLLVSVRDRHRRQGARDDSFSEERLDLRTLETEFGQQLYRVLADGRRLMPETEVVTSHLDRQARHFGPRSIRKQKIEHAIVRVQLRIVEQISRFRHRRKWNPDAIEYFRQL